MPPPESTRSAAAAQLASFDDLLRAARAQPDAQRLLFVFAGVGLPADATPAQRALFEAGEGGELSPVMCVDKGPHELEGFAALAGEAALTGQDWALVFVAALAGRGGEAPGAAQVDAALKKMVESIATGAFGACVPFDRDGRPVTIG
jgi:hypothetical protein